MVVKVTVARHLRFQEDGFNRLHLEAFLILLPLSAWMVCGVAEVLIQLVVVMEDQNTKVEEVHTHITIISVAVAVAAAITAEAHQIVVVVAADPVTCRIFCLILCQRAD